MLKLVCLSCWDLSNHGVSCYALDIFGKLLMSRGASTWLQIVWSYGVEAIDRWINFSVKIKSNWNWKLYWNMGVFLVLLESPWWIRFNRFYFIIFRGSVWKILIFEWILFWKFKKIAKNGFERKNKSSLQCVYTTGLRNFQFWKCEN
jgi:hypothetical protein